MKLKMQPGMSGSLCVSCRMGQTITYENGDRAIYCHEFAYRAPRIVKPVVQCTAFQEKNTASMRQMEDIAWTLRTNKRGEAIGFSRPSTTRNDDY